MRSRRSFLVSAAACLSLGRLAFPQPSPTRLNLAEIDRIRILAAANQALARPSNPTRDLGSEAWLSFTLDVPALAAAALIDAANASKYAAAAATQLDLWLLDPRTKPMLTLTSFEQLIDLAGLAEVAVALPFLPLAAEQRARLNTSFAHLLTFLMEDRTALLARDAKSHHGSAWLLQVSACARLTSDDAVLSECRHRFKTSTIRAQIDASGLFPHELTDPNPLRNSLFNLDLLAGTCVLLSTRFESLWDHELQDGPGMRAAIARFAPYIRERRLWPYPADREHFNLLPGRRPALLFAARAYSQAEYAALWRTLNPDSSDQALLRTFPIRQPILWQTQAKPPA